MRADLHVHSSASDGTLTPAMLVRSAARGGLDVIAITDHDSVEGVAPAIEAALDHDLEVIPAVELSSHEDGFDVHILGYYVDYTALALTDILLSLRQSRIERALAMIGSLRRAGYDISTEDVFRLAAGGSVGRSHIARILVGTGQITSVQDAFERLIGRKNPHYVQKPLATPREVVRLIRSFGGLPVLAHPGVGGTGVIIDDLIAAGLGGIEVYHPEHSGEQTRAYAELARERGLAVTGGSDYHGPEGPGPGLGDVLLPSDVVSSLRAAARRA